MDTVLNTAKKKKKKAKQKTWLQTPILIIHLIDLVCMQSTEIMQLENLEQSLSNKKQGGEYMGSRKTVDSSNLIWALFSDFENPREFASRTVDLTENKLFRECSTCEIMFSFFFFRSISISPHFHLPCRHTQIHKHTHIIYNSEGKTLLTYYYYYFGGIHFKF